ARFGVLGARPETFSSHYGLSETAGVSTWNERCGPQFVAIDGVEVANCGRPASGITLRIVDPDSGACRKEGELGEVWVKSPGVAGAYLGDEAASRQAFGGTLAESGESNFFRTGDRGLLRDGCLYIAGRDKDVIIVRGK